MSDKICTWKVSGVEYALCFVLGSHWGEHTKLMTSLIINLKLAVFYKQSHSCEVINKSKGDLNSSNSIFFPLCPPLSISIARLLVFFAVYISLQKGAAQTLATALQSHLRLCISAKACLQKLAKAHAFCTRKSLRKHDLQNPNCET